jgi:hypothetical protein
MQRSLVAAVVAAAGCGTPPKHPSPPASPLERFTSILERGQSLYGLDAGCDEWRAAPGDPDIDMSEGEEGAEPLSPPPWSFAGRLTARADADGRIYGFSYYVYKDTSKLRISGRGGWSPAPGVTIKDPAHEGWGTIGSPSMCTTMVDLRADPHVQDAVLVGGETWYLTQAACLHDRHGAPSADHKGCAASKR